MGFYEQPRPSVASIVTLWIVGASIIGAEEVKTYKGYQLLSLRVNQENDVTFLLDMEENTPSIEFWILPTLQDPSANLLVPPDLLDEVTSQLSDHNIDVEVIHRDISSLIQASSIKTPKHVVRKRMAEGGHVIDHHNYHRYDEIKDYLLKLQRKYPRHLTMSKMSKETLEGRDIIYVKLSGTSKVKDKPVILMDAGIHAREWLAPASALYLVEQLLLQYQRDDTFAKKVLDEYDLFMIPVLNPDGYAYTQTDRFWRKNRRQFPEYRCYGVDLNRNFDIMFNTSDSQRYCQLESFQGPSAFSERESQGFRELFYTVRSRLKIYLSLHTFGQMLLKPWSYTRGEEEPDNVEELNRIGLAMVEAIQSRQRKNYTFGTPFDLLSYVSTGSSLDWVLAEKPGVIAFVFELRPSLQGPSTGYDFIQPSDQIIPTGEDIYTSFIPLINGTMPPKTVVKPDTDNGSITTTRGSLALICLMFCRCYSFMYMM